MYLAQFVRSWGFLLVFGLASLLLGCSGQDQSPPGQEAGKKIAEERKAERKERKEAMLELKKGGMRGMMKGRGHR
jgi:hypothetical protein